MVIFLLLGEGTSEIVGEIVGWLCVYIVRCVGLVGPKLEQYDGDFVRVFFSDGWKQMVEGGVIERSRWLLCELLAVTA